MAFVRHVVRSAYNMKAHITQIQAKLAISGYVINSKNIGGVSYVGK